MGYAGGGTGHGNETLFLSQVMAAFFNEARRHTDAAL